MQALDRSQPVLPMMPGMPERRTHDYVRHGITSLFAAFNIADGTRDLRTAPPAPGGGVQEVPRRDRQGRPRRAGRAPGLRQPRHPQDPGDQDWLARHPRFHMHFTPTGSSWINQVERWFGLPHRPDSSAAASTKASWPWKTTSATGSADWNEDPKPFVWTKTADEILESLAKYIATISGAGH